jgi:hypothetical protein
MFRRASLLNEREGTMTNAEKGAYALLQKALPIIKAEAESRGDWGERHNEQEHSYATEMRDLATDIEAEIAGLRILAGETKEGNNERSNDYN